MSANAPDPAQGLQKQETVCPISQVFALLGRPFAMDILYVMLRKDRALRFSDLQEAIPTTPGTLSQRLKDLAAAGVITRTAFAEVPPRVEYALTPMGSSLDPIFDTITAWAKTYRLQSIEAWP